MTITPFVDNAYLKSVVASMTSSASIGVRLCALPCRTDVCVTTVILPKANLKDVSEIPRQLKRKMTFIAVESMREVLDAALERAPLSRREPPKLPANPISQHLGQPRLSEK